MSRPNLPPQVTPKVHPTSREVLPDDPLELQAFEVAGDPDLMLRLLVEDYARMGSSADEIKRLARDPNYQVFFALRRRLGDIQFEQRIHDILSRCGVFRVSMREAPPPPAESDLFQIGLALDSPSSTGSETSA